MVGIAHWSMEHGCLIQNWQVMDMLILQILKDGMQYGYDMPMNEYIFYICVKSASKWLIVKIT